jgi:hypothetical protein
MNAAWPALSGPCWPPPPLRAALAGAVRAITTWLLEQHIHY